MRCQRTDHLLPGLIVIGLSAFLFRVCSVEPYLIHLAVFGEDFEQLVHEVLVIVVHHELEFRFVGKRTSFHFTRNGAQGLFASVSVQAFRILNLVQVGRRQIDTQLQAVLLARFGKVSQNIPLAVLESGGHDAMFRISGLPQTETVVVLHGEHHQLHAGRLDGLAPLVGIQCFQIKDRRIFLTGSPFHTGECVRSEVDKGNELLFQSAQLVVGRNHVSRLLDNHFLRVRIVYLDGIV